MTITNEDDPITRQEALERDDCDMWGIISDNYICVDCGMDTWPGHETRAEVEQSMRAAKAAGKKWKSTITFTAETEVYYVHPHVWEASGVGFWNGVLCIGCLEKRIGRRLQPFDFMAEHAKGFNDPNLPGTQRRLERLLGQEVLLMSEPSEPPLEGPSKFDLAYQAAFGKQWVAA
jgi:hypothetical protein